MDTAPIHAHIDTHRDEYLDIFKKLVAQPSISAQNIGIRECAGLLKGMMEKIGIKANILETKGQPVIYGELPRASTEGPTVLFYGHYDVQPPEPFEAWISPPFEPTIREGRLYGRGTGDNKGQLLAHVLAVRSYLETAKSLPISVKFLFDGEEEMGSPNLPDFVENHRELLHADVVFSADGPMHDVDTPLATLGFRGVMSFEMEIQTATHDNHSGNKGGTIPNAAWELVGLLSTMVDRDGNILIEDFYEDVLPPNEGQLRLIDKLEYDPVATAQIFGVNEIRLTKKDFYDRLMFKPTLTINGLTSGYGGDGTKTVIPCKGKVKMDIRLVPDQDGQKVFRTVERHVAKYYPNVKVTFKNQVLPSVTLPDLPVCVKIFEGMEQAYGKPPVITPMVGGTLPNFVWTKILGIPAIGASYANPDEDNHAPNENMDIECFYKGIHASAQIIHQMSTL
jgi:acetylornithine deacetylase/succinyl-diaminopimelate desuccinylase-like protein